MCIHIHIHTKVSAPDTVQALDFVGCRSETAVRIAVCAFTNDKTVFVHFSCADQAHDKVYDQPDQKISLFHRKDSFRFSDEDHSGGIFRRCVQIYGDLLICRVILTVLCPLEKGLFPLALLPL